MAITPFLSQEHGREPTIILFVSTGAWLEVVEPEAGAVPTRGTWRGVAWRATGPEPDVSWSLTAGLARRNPTARFLLLAGGPGVHDLCRNQGPNVGCIDLNAADAESLFPAVLRRSPLIELSLIRPPRPVGAGQAVDFVLEVRNLSRETLEGGSQAVLRANGYFAESAAPLAELAPGRVAAVALRATCQRDVTLDDLEAEVQVEVLGAWGNRVVAQAFVLELADFSAALDTGLPLMVAAVGRPESGVEEFVTAVRSALGSAGRRVEVLRGPEGEEPGEPIAVATNRFVHGGIQILSMEGEQLGFRSNAGRAVVSSISVSPQCRRSTRTAPAPSRPTCARGVRRRPSSCRGPAWTTRSSWRTCAAARTVRPRRVSVLRWPLTTSLVVSPGAHWRRALRGADQYGGAAGAPDPRGRLSPPPGLRPPRAADGAGGMLGGTLRLGVSNGARPCFHVTSPAFAGQILLGCRLGERVEASSFEAGREAVINLARLTEAAAEVERRRGPRGPGGLHHRFDYEEEVRGGGDLGAWLRGSVGASFRGVGGAALGPGLP
jgi:hypothetical protein